MSTDLIDRLRSTDRATQRAACDEVVAHLPQNPELRDPVLDLLRGKSVHGRFAAAYILFQEGPTLRLLPALLDSLELPDGDLRWSAAHMLNVLGRTQGEVLPVLLHEATQGASSLRRRMALYAARELGPERAETEAAFVTACEDPDPEVRRAALSSCAKLPEPSERLIASVLEHLINDADPKMRRIAAVVLPDLVRDHEEATEAARTQLDQLRDDPDTELARACDIALIRMST